MFLGSIILFVIITGNNLFLLANQHLMPMLDGYPM